MSFDSGDGLPHDHWEEQGLSVEEDEPSPDASIHNSVVVGHSSDDVNSSDDVTSSGGVPSFMNNPTAVMDDAFEELNLEATVITEVQAAWEALMQSGGSREAAGESIYTAIFDGAPSLQGLFRTPRAIMAMRLMSGLNQIVASLGDPVALKGVVETFGFQHMDLEVTVPRVVIFRDALLDLMEVEVGDCFTPVARYGWATLMNYVGGAYIYIRVTYAERLHCITSSWAQANQANSAPEGDVLVSEEASGSSPAQSFDGKDGPASRQNRAHTDSNDWKRSPFGSSETGSGEYKSRIGVKSAFIPRTFEDMFMFNVAVMGFGQSGWMREVLKSFQTIVNNVANTYRLQEECDLISLRISKYSQPVVLADYKMAMLASLRSLVPAWGALHETSWSWLWENVERMLQVMVGRPRAMEAALDAFFHTLDETALGNVRREVYKKFFVLAPKGQEYFKQSTTRLHFIVDKAMFLTLDMYREPKRMVDHISALGLRHVGYGIPTYLFGPYVQSFMEVVKVIAEPKAEEAFRWSVSLVSRMLTRVINEGSTLVMQAINVNSADGLKRAVACAPRGTRALWTLNVQVGSQSISPLMWAIETGSLDAAHAIIVDLTTIRADRDRYYCGIDTLFERHPDIIKRLCADAPGLLPVLLDGLIWRSRVAVQGQRTVHYYVKHLLMDSQGGFAPAIPWLTEHGDPNIMCHPVVSWVSDCVWIRVALAIFLRGKAWFLFTLSLFILAEATLKHTKEAYETPGDPRGQAVQAAIFAGRCFIYFCSMGRLVFYHSGRFLADFRRDRLVHVGFLRVPAYLEKWHDRVSFSLLFTLLVQLCFEPILHCFASEDERNFLFTDDCKEGERLKEIYSFIVSVAMVLYFLLLADISVVSTRMSSLYLAACRLLSELALYLTGLCFTILAFSCAVTALEQDDVVFDGLPLCILGFARMAFGTLSGNRYDGMADWPALQIAGFLFAIIVVIFLTNLLVAQLSCGYQERYKDMVGFARLGRGEVLAYTMRSVSASRWSKFTASLRLDTRLEFGEGDIGLAGGVQITEPASLYTTTEDAIRRYGGSTSAAEPWPKERTVTVTEETDKLRRIERMLERGLKRSKSRRSPSSVAASFADYSMSTVSGASGNAEPE